MNLLLKTFAFASLSVGMAITVEAAVQEGTFTAIVTSASDPGQLSFGRDPVTWVGKTVNGTFAYDVATPGIVDQDSAAALWTYGDPARNTRWVHVAASIDGVDFATSARDAVPTGTIGGVVQIWDGTFGGGDWYGVQDAYLSVAGRSVIGIDVFGPASLFSYAGSGGGVDFAFDPSQPGVAGSGLIEDIAISAGVEVRSGTIRFRLTSLTLGKSTEALISDLLTAVTGVGPGRLLARIVEAAQTYYAVPDVQATCAATNFFATQVRLIARLSRLTRWPAVWKISMAQADQLLGDAGAISAAIGCQ